MKCWEGSGFGILEVGEEVFIFLSDIGLRGRSLGSGRAGWEVVVVASVIFGDIEVEEIVVEDGLD